MEFRVLNTFFSNPARNHDSDEEEERYKQPTERYLFRGRDRPPVIDRRMSSRRSQAIVISSDEEETLSFDRYSVEEDNDVTHDSLPFASSLVSDTSGDDGGDDDEPLPRIVWHNPYNDLFGTGSPQKAHNNATRTTDGVSDLLNRVDAFLLDHNDNNDFNMTPPLRSPGH